MEIIALDPALTINILVVQRTHSKTDLSGPAGLQLSSALSLACRALPNHRLLLRSQRHTFGWFTAGFDTRRPEGGKGAACELASLAVRQPTSISGTGTFRTWQARLTMSVLEGNADFPIARPDF
jgi:hypothetical protein